MQVKEGFKAVPYAYWFSKIKSRTNQRIVTKDLLKDVFMREICCDDNKERKGGNKKGVPKKYLWALINDMRNISFQPRNAVPFKPLITKLNNSSQSNYEITTCQEYKKIIINPFPFWIIFFSYVFFYAFFFSL